MDLERESERTATGCRSFVSFKNKGHVFCGIELLFFLLVLELSTASHSLHQQKKLLKL